MNVSEKVSITVAAGPVMMSSRAGLFADGNVAILSLASPVRLDVVPTPHGNFGLPSSTTLANVELSGSSQVETAGVGGGRIDVHAANLFLKAWRWMPRL